MHPHPRQNNTFTGFSGGYEALFATPHRFSFNGQERTDEIAGTGNHTTALYWEYDTRLGRRWNMDPVIYPFESIYATNHNSPLLFNDSNGDSPGEYKHVYDKKSGTYSSEKVSDKGDDEGVDYHKYEGGILDNSLLTYNSKGRTYSEQFKWADTRKRETNFTQWNEVHGSEYSNRIEAYRAWQSDPNYHEGESFWDRTFRLMAYGSLEARRDFASGGMNMYSGYFRSQKYSVEVISNLNSRFPGYVPLVTRIGGSANKSAIFRQLQQIAKGDWIKVYQGGHINGKATEIHFYLHKATGKIANPKLKYSDQIQTILKQLGY